MSVCAQNTFDQSEPPGQTPSSVFAEAGINVNKEHVGSADDRENVMYLNDQHCGLVMKELKNQRQTGAMCDAVLLVNDSLQLKAHKCILAANSPYFNSHLSNGGLNTLPVQVSDPKAFEAILDYMYSGQLSVSMASADELLSLCEKLAMADIKMCCIQHMEKSMDISNWLQMLKLAELHTLEGLRSAVQKFAIDNFSLIHQEKEILELSHSMFENILRRCNADMDCDIESYAMEAVLRWTAHNYEARKGSFPQLLNMLRSDIISKDCLDQILLKPGIRDSDILQHNLLEELVNKVHTKHEEDQRRQAEKELVKLTESVQHQGGDAQTITEEQLILSVKKEIDILDNHIDEDMGVIKISSEGSELKVEHQNQVKCEAEASSPETCDHPPEVSDADTDLYDPVAELTGAISQTADYERSTNISRTKETGTDSTSLNFHKPVVVLEALSPLMQGGKLPLRSKRKASKPVKISCSASEDLECAAVPVKRPRGRPPKNRTGLAPLPKPKLKVKAKVIKKKTKSFGTQTLEDTIGSLLDDDENENDGFGEEDEEGDKPKVTVKVKKRGRYKHQGGETSIVLDISLLPKCFL